MTESTYRGWSRSGPVPPGGIEPEPGESLDYLCGYYRIFQYEKGHRYSTDDVLTAWYASQWAPRVDRAADLGSGIGSVAMITAWRLPGATFCTVEAQDISIRLARKSVRYNGLEERFTLYQGDLRDASVLEHEQPFDLVTGSPPYFPPGTASLADHAQAIPARSEVRGGIEDYAEAASRILAHGGLFVFVFPTAQCERAGAALNENGLTLLRRRDIVFKEGKPPMISLFAGSLQRDLPSSFRPGARTGKPVIEPPLIIRSSDGAVDPEYATVRLSFGCPPGDVGPDE